MSTELKKRAAYQAVEHEIRSSMKVGLGSGSTVAFALDALGEALQAGRLTNMVGVPTSEQTASRAREWGIPLVELHEVEVLDVTIDGADEVDPNLNLIKGLGAALLREKMVAQITQRFVIIADNTKKVQYLGQKAPLPVEVVPFGWQSHLRFLAQAGATPRRREKEGQPIVTDNGCYIIDCTFDLTIGIEDPQVLEWLLLARAGIVDHGLFLDMAAIAYIAGDDGVEIMTRAMEG
jgi:ribose 5-phosphate isomerase A